jgi:hypothetical protein
MHPPRFGSTPARRCGKGAGAGGKLRADGSTTSATSAPAVRSRPYGRDHTGPPEVSRIGAKEPPRSSVSLEAPASRRHEREERAGRRTSWPRCARRRRGRTARGSRASPPPGPAPRSPPPPPPAHSLPRPRPWPGPRSRMHGRGPPACPRPSWRCRRLASPGAARGWFEEE